MNSSDRLPTADYRLWFIITPVNLPEPKLITTQPQLEELVAEFKDAPRIAVDTESNSLHAYQEQVCLIQFSIPGSDYLVDPITLHDLSPLGPIFADPETETIFHAAEYDLICLKRDFGFTFRNLFDTQVAARILGWKKVGLGSILESQFGVKLNKKYQRADWKARPLSAEMMRYAQLDTHYLIDLRDRLEEELKAHNLLALAEEDFRRGCEVNGSAPTPKDQLAFRVSRSHELTPQQMAVLQELCLYRDRVAQRLDRPLFKVISDQTLVEIARHCPFDFSDLGDVPGVRSWLLRKHGRDILAAVKRGLEAEPLETPNHSRPGAAFFNRMDAVHTWRKITARKMGVESDIVLPRDLMEEVVQQNPRSEGALEAILESVPWRLEHFGDDLFDVLQRTNRR